MQESLTASMRFDVCKLPTPDPNPNKVTPPTLSPLAPKKEPETVCQAYPELERIKGFKEFPFNSGPGKLNRELVLRYVIILYSEDSILNEIRPLPPLEERMYRAADLAGFKRRMNGEFKDYIVEKLFFLQDDKVVRAALEFLQFQMNDIWTEMSIIGQELMEARKIRFTPVGDDKDKDNVTTISNKRKLRDECKAMIKDLVVYESEFFKDHENLKNVVKRERVTIESIAGKQ